MHGTWYTIGHELDRTWDIHGHVHGHGTQIMDMDMEVVGVDMDMDMDMDDMDMGMDMDMDMVLSAAITFESRQRQHLSCLVGRSRELVEQRFNHLYGGARLEAAPPRHGGCQLPCHVRQQPSI